MNPSKPTAGITFNTTESMAELAWRYGENCLPFRKIGGTCFFIDGSCMGRRGVDSALGFRYVVDRFFKTQEGRFL